MLSKYTKCEQKHKPDKNNQPKEMILNGKGKKYSENR